MKKITLLLTAIALSLGVLAQGNTSGKQLVKYERYSSAKKALANASSEEDKYYLGLAEIGLGNYAAASTIFTALGESPYGKAGLARIAYLQGKKQQGNDLVNGIVDGAKRKEYYKYQLAADAITYTQNGDVDKAIEWYKKVIEKDPTAEGLVSLGDAYLLKRDALSNGEADRSFTDAIKINPNYSLAQSRMGNLMLSGRNYEKALDFYKKAQTSDPNNPLPYKDLATAYYGIGNYKVAKENADKYISLSDASDADMYQYINILFLSKDYTGALSKINEFTSKNPSYKSYLDRLKGFSEYELGQYDQALTSLNKFMQTKDAKIISEDYKYKGMIYAALAPNDTAKFSAYLDSSYTAFEKADQLDTSNDKSKFYLDIAESYVKVQDYKKAANYYGKIIDAKKATTYYDYYMYGFYSYYGYEFDQAATAFDEMYNKFENERYLSEYWRGLVAAARDSDAKTGLAEQYYLNWLAMEMPADNPRTNDQLLSAYNYLTYYYYNKKNSASAVKYAKLIQTIEPDNKFAIDIVNNLK